MYRSKKLRESARGAPCLMHGPNCTGGGTREDVCWRHSNSMKHGKATGIKAHDLFGFYGCQPCEDWYSGLTGGCPIERNAKFLVAWEMSMIYACEQGVL